MSSHSTPEAPSHTDNNDSGGGQKILLPLFLLIMLAAAAWYLLGANHKKEGDETISKHSEEHGNAETVKEEKATTVFGKADTLGNFIYDLGKLVTIELPNGAGKLEVGEFSTENKLYQFLHDASAKLDTVKGNWFEFTNVRFKTGGMDLDSSSMQQLKNFIAITKGFPKAEFKIGGYTDNSGDSAKNVSLSQKRADAVLASLKKSGTATSSLTGAKGYGPLHPIGDNATADGKAMNRRVAVNVKAK